MRVNEETTGLSHVYDEALQKHSHQARSVELYLTRTARVVMEFGMRRFSGHLEEAEEEGPLRLQLPVGQVLGTES